MKNTSGLEKNREVLFLLATLIIVACLSGYLVSATPQGATVSSVSVDTGPTKSPASRTDPGGRIITVDLNLEQQNYGWKAYVGNATGTYVLQNANNKSIYEWPLSTVAGELYISRGSAVNFSNVYCANSSQINTENTFFGFSGSDSDSINKTFNSTSHSAFSVGTISLVANNCSATATWVNDTIQPQSSAAIFQEMLLSDGSNIVYASILNNDRSGYDNVSTFDFQSIVADNRSSASGATYYFYLELG